MSKIRKLDGLSGGMLGGLAYFVAGLIIILSTATCTGCSVSKAYVDADRATYTSVAPKFLKYTEADPELSPGEKETQALLIQSWDLRIRKAEGK